ncbi:hypothetical protein [Macrococcus carouselicus]|nr:hypothetical protein [Macrococcus carouselicus]
MRELFKYRKPYKGLFILYFGHFDNMKKRSAHLLMTASLTFHL